MRKNATKVASRKKRAAPGSMAGYNKVQAWKSKNPGSNMKTAFTATNVASSAYYAQKRRRLEAQLHQPLRKFKKKLAEAVLEAATEKLAVPGIKPGMVIAGSPEDVAKLLDSLGGGDAGS